MVRLKPMNRHGPSRLRAKLQALGSGLALATLLALASSCGDAASPPSTPSWTTGWATAFASVDSPIRFEDVTLRQVVRSTLSGERLRVRVSNALGREPIEIAGAAVARRDSSSSIVAGSSQTITFAGEPSARLAPGEERTSDPLSFSVKAGQDLTISLYLESPNELFGLHPIAQATSFVSERGNFAEAIVFPTARTSGGRFLVSAVDVMPPTPTSTLVALGDSITDGFRSTPDAFASWPDRLAERLGGRMGVLNTGISGNRVLSESSPPFGPSALDRFERDVLGHHGVSHLIVLEGINDIRFGRASSAEVIAGLEEIIQRARAAGLIVVGGTLTPFGGAAGSEPRQEVERQALNRWIREVAPFDAIVDFDAALRDPAVPTRLLPAYDSDDHLHPGDAGYRAMGDAVDLSILLDSP